MMDVKEKAQEESTLFNSGYSSYSTRKNAQEEKKDERMKAVLLFQDMSSSHFNAPDFCFSCSDAFKEFEISCQIL